MFFEVRPSKVDGVAAIPASKSHTIRALFLGALGHGVSEALHPLRSRDTAAAAAACRAFGAIVRDDGPHCHIEGFGGRPRAATGVIDVLNSGTTLRIAMSTAALARGETRLTGDEQIRSRPIGPLEDALKPLGARVSSAAGKPPVTIQGPMRGGRTKIRAVSSQYLTSLLINCPFVTADTEIEVIELNEAPYVEMTLNWLDRLGIKYTHENMMRFRIPGGQGHGGFSARVPADFSSATFFLVAAAITGGEILLEGLDMNDTQGDRAVIGMVERMGAEVEVHPNGVRVKGRALKGKDFDLNATPDALPAMAVAGCFADGTTRLLNVPQARIKETDRIAVMARELAKMGARIEELPDGLVIQGGGLRGAEVEGWHDHRVVMSLCVAGLAAEGVTKVSTAEAVDVTFPDFPQLLAGAGGNIRTI